MTVDVKVIKCPDVFQDGLKVFAVSFLLGVCLPEWRKIRIIAVYHMGGTDDKVEVILRENIGMQRCQMRLEPQLDAVAHADLIPVLFLHGENG